MAAVGALAAMLPFSVGPAGSAPPIACVKARGNVQQAICADPALVAMDREVAALYDRGLAELRGGARHQLVLSQQAFVRRREGCNWASHHSAHPGVAIEECARNMMEERVRALRATTDRF